MEVKSVVGSGAFIRSRRSTFDENQTGFNAANCALFAGGAAFATLVAIGIQGAQALLATPERHQERSPTALRGSLEASQSTPAASSVGAVSDPAGTASSTAQLEALKRKLSVVLSQKSELEGQLRGLELDRERRPETAAPERDEFDLSREDWKALAATGHVKYRVPCVLPNDPSYSTPADELDQLGLGPDDGKLLAEAQRRSNARIWATVRPLCAKLVGGDSVVDRLGAQSCLSLIERAANESDPIGSFEARRAVGEVHAGLREAPDLSEQSPVYQAYMALTREGSQFEADLAESFGPEEAGYIARNMRCASTRK